MDTNLLQMVKDKKRVDRLRSTLRYAALLENHTNAGEGDAAELAELMEHLGKTHEQVFADINALNQAKTCRSQIAALPSLDPARAELQAALRKMIEEHAVVIAALKAKEEELHLRLYQVESELTTSRGAPGRLAQLMAAYPGVVTLAGFAKPSALPATNGATSPAAKEAGTDETNR
jgi:transposase